MAGVIEDPAGFVPLQALAFGTLEAPATAVDDSNPLPVRAVRLATASAALAGSTGASMLAGPFVPDLGVAIWVMLAGSWAGSVQVLRSLDAGVTKLPLTVAGQPWAVFTAAANEPIGEESSAAATYWLAITLSSGTLTYQVAQ